MGKIIYMSFKDSEMDLYKKIKSHHSYSGWLKDAAKEKIEREESGQNNQKPKIPNNRPVFKDF